MKNLSSLKEGDFFLLLLAPEWIDTWNRQHWFASQAIHSHWKKDLNCFALPVKLNNRLHFSFTATGGAKDKEETITKFTHELNLKPEYLRGVLDAQGKPMDGNLWHLIGNKMDKIRKSIKEGVIGQDHTVETMIAALISFEMNLFFPSEFNKPFMLIAGPSGTGKTEIVRNLCGYRISTFDCSNLTPAGYKGTNVEDLVRLIKQERKEYPNAPLIIFLDEIDKLSISHGENQQMTKSSQGNLLKILEGTNFKLPTKNEKQQDVVETIDTTNVFFIAAGAFSHSLIPSSEMTMKDFISAGMMPELMGRVTHFTHTKPLTREVMKRIILESKNSSFLAMKARLEVFNIKLILTDAYLDHLITQASSNVLGARVVEQEIQSAMNPYWQRLGEFLNKELVLDVELPYNSMMNVKREALS